MQHTSGRFVPENTILKSFAIYRYGGHFEDVTNFNPSVSTTFEISEKNISKYTFSNPISAERSKVSLDLSCLSMVSVLLSKPFLNSMVTLASQSFEKPGDFFFKIFPI